MSETKPALPDVMILADFARTTLDLANARLSDEYYYSCLPNCVVDAVYSIGVRYSSVQATVKRYCSYAAIPVFRPVRGELPDRSSQQSISQFCRLFDQVGLDGMVNQVFKNRQRTSPRNGILKAEAVIRFARALQSQGYEYLQDVSEGDLKDEVGKRVCSIPGQRSGISYEYFQMLAGSDARIKPDRMILRYVGAALRREVSTSEAKHLLIEAVQELKRTHPQLTPRLLDFVVWSYQRGQRPVDAVTNSA